MHGQTLGADRPLCFLHIAKTGGTSVTDALARFYPAERVFSDTDLTVGYLEQLTDRLEGPAFIAGHAGLGVARHLDGKADLITVLRRPEDQAVSNYLHALATSDHGLHEAAMRLPFPDYLREHQDQLCFQSGSLAFALSDDSRPVDPTDADCAGLVLDFLDSMPFVGVIERPDDCGEALGQLIGLDAPLQLPCLNAAVYRGVSSRTIQRLHAQYRSLADDPSLSRRLQVEAAVYARAEAILDRLLASGAAVGGLRKPGGFVGARRFSTRNGELQRKDLICGLAETTEHMVYGPFDRLPRGHHAAEFHLAIAGAPARGPGRLELDIFANGKSCLARRWLDVTASASHHCRTLAFFNDDAANVIEFRIRAQGFATGALAFRGVSIRRSELARTWRSAIMRRFHDLRRRGRAWAQAARPDGEAGSGKPATGFPVQNPR